MNAFTRLFPNQIDQFSDKHDGYPDELKQQDTRDVLISACGAAATDFPASWLIPRSEWADRARENDKHGLWARNRIWRHTHQGESHECTGHSHEKGMTAARNRARGFSCNGPTTNMLAAAAEYDLVSVSPISLYQPVNPGQWGGAMIRDILDQSVRVGALPSTKQPKNYGFQHQINDTIGPTNSVQDGGSWPRRLPEGYANTAKHFRVVEVIFPETVEEAVSLVLWGYMVCVGRNGHAVPWDYLHVTDNALGYTDSYNRFLADSWRTAQSAVYGSYSIISVTVPDDWSRPAA